MVLNETTIFLKQFRRRVKMERERERKWTHAKIFKVEMFFSSLKIFFPFS
jgi:hypothetical protein